MPSVPLDLRAAARSLVRRPAFTAAVVATLALGVGATTAVFTVVDRVLLRPLPFPAPERLVAVWETADDGARVRSAAPANFLDWRRESRALPEMAGWDRRNATLGGEPVAERVTVAKVSASFFEVLGAQPARGRTFTPEAVAAGPEVVLSHGLWRRRFGADPAVVGRAVVLDGEPSTVVGVMPPEVAFPAGADLWSREADGVPGGLPPETRDAWYFGVVARRAPGVSLADAAAEMARIAGGLAAAHPETNRGTGVRLVPLLEDQVGAVRATLLLLLGGAGLVLLVACVNVANLLLVRASGRSGELTLRAALGAGRRHLVGRTLAEAGLLAALGGAAGAALAWVAVPAAGRALAGGLPRTGDLAVDGRVLAFGVVVTGLALVLAGAGPALVSARPGVAAAGAGRGRGTGRRAGRLRGALVSLEVALALGLVAGASLILRTGAELRAVDPGFEPEGLLALGVALPATGEDPRAERVLGWASLRDRVAALPGVEAAAVAQAGPTEGGWGAGLKVEGRPVAPDEELDVAWQVVGEGYFAAAGVRVLRGRAFGPGDREGAEPVGVVSASLARSVWPGEDAVGRRVRVGLDGPDWVTVVGVVEDTRNRGPTAPPQPALYRPLAQRSAWPADEALLLVRHRDVPGTAEAVRRAVATARPDAPLLDLRSGARLLGEHTERTALVLRVLGAFAALALALGAVGIYGVAASLVAERTRELAVRRALGAGGAAVAGLVLRGGLVVVASGLAAGAGLALLAGRLLQGLLFGVGPADPAALLGAAGVLTLSALLAMAGPARRAARVEPADALRE